MSERSERNLGKGAAADGAAVCCFAWLREVSFAVFRQDWQAGSGECYRLNADRRFLWRPVCRAERECWKPPANVSQGQDEGLQVWTNNGNLEELFEPFQFRYP